MRRLAHTSAGRIKLSDRKITIKVGQIRVCGWTYVFLLTTLQPSRLVTSIEKRDPFAAEAALPRADFAQTQAIRLYAIITK
jgi:hypothetical protein